ncbi:MAG: PAS domain S-box protein [Chloroflexi bacterium]|nr:PAS domain S-box protein [Chloroflexota bacterium]
MDGVRLSLISPSAARRNQTREQVESRDVTIKPEPRNNDMALIANLADAVFEFKEGVLVWCNERVKDIYGYTRNELIGKKAGFFLPKDMDAGEFVNKVSESIEKHGVFRSTVVVRKKDDSLADIEYVISRTKTNGRDKVIVVARDVTAHKQAEKEKERLLAELADKTRELEQIVYVTSHDLRSPLVNIQGFTRELDQSFKEINEVLKGEGISPQLKKKLTPIINEDIPLAFQYILTGSAKMDSLLSGLLRLSRLGRAALNIRQLDMNRLMADVVASVEFQIKEAKAKVEIEDLPPCYGDEVQINQVFSNLLDNALKFLNPKRRGKIKIRGKADKEQTVYCIEDNGIGIEEKDKQVIFEIFRRLDPGSCPGEGLGLTIVRKILDRHGGKVWVESEPGKGSRFFVSLPAGVSQSNELPITFGEL